MNGYDKAKNLSTKLKEEKEQQEIKKAEMTASGEEAMKKAQAIMADNPEWRKMVEEDAKKEMEKQGIQLPLLKVYVANKSLTLLADGSTPSDGFFIYMPTKTEYPDVQAHILHISRGFRTEGLPDEDGKTKHPYTHLIIGVFINDGDMKPFTIILTGQARINKLWDFQKQLRDVPKQNLTTFSVLVNLKTEKVWTEDKNKKKRQATVINFEFLKDDAGQYYTVSNQADYISLRERVSRAEEFSEKWIAKNEVFDDEPEPTKIEESETVKEVNGEVHITEAKQPALIEEVNPDDIPF